MQNLKLLSLILKMLLLHLRVLMNLRSSNFKSKNLIIAPLQLIYNRKGAILLFNNLFDYILTFIGINGGFMISTYRIAEKNIQITSIHSKVHDYCKLYKTNGVPDFSVETVQNDIDFEREKSARENIAEGHPVVNYPDEYLEELAVYRKIVEKMLDYDTFLFHGSVISVDGEGYLFTAKSGTGKSTHTRLWRELFGDRAVMVNDDKPLLRVTDKGVTVYGTPYNGKHGLGCNIAVPLKSICILTRAEENNICSVSPEKVYPILLQQVYRPSDKDKLLKTIDLIDRTVKHVKLYKLGCNMDLSAAEIAYNGMKG